MAKASFAAGVRFARGLLPQDELLPSHVVVALGLGVSRGSVRYRYGPC
jgi:hypothetical protein